MGESESVGEGEGEREGETEDESVGDDESESDDESEMEPGDGEGESEGDAEGEADDGLARVAARCPDATHGSSAAAARTAVGSAASTTNTDASPQAVIAEGANAQDDANVDGGRRTTGGQFACAWGRHQVGE